MSSVQGRENLRVQRASTKIYKNWNGNVLKPSISVAEVKLQQISIECVAFSILRFLLTPLDSDLHSLQLCNGAVTQLVYCIPLDRN